MKRHSVIITLVIFGHSPGYYSTGDMIVKFLLVSLFCHGLWDTNSFHDALANISASKHLAESHVAVTSTSPVLLGTLDVQGTSPDSSEGEIGNYTY